MAGEDIKNSHRGGQSIKYTKRQSSVKNSFVTKAIQFIETSYVLFFGLRKKSQEISHATIAIHCLKGSTLGERTD